MWWHNGTKSCIKKCKPSKNENNFCFFYSSHPSRKSAKVRNEIKEKFLLENICMQHLHMKLFLISSSFFLSRKIFVLYSQVIKKEKEEKIWWIGSKSCYNFHLKLVALQHCRCIMSFWRLKSKICVDSKRKMQWEFQSLKI